MSARFGEEPIKSRGATSWNDGLYPINGAGLTNRSITQTQGVSAGPGGTQRGDAGAVPQTSWFTAIEEDTECPGGVCPVPWATQETSPVVQEDVVNHPAHYTEGGIETIDAIEAALTNEEFRGYCKGNCIKYIWRERHKGGTESLKKARWYLDRLIALDESQNG